MVPALLPVIERELRVCARRAGTYWARFGAGLVIAGLITALLLLNQWWVTKGAGFITGGILFDILKIIGLVAILVGGLFLATDAIAEERREGTLGLLLLTPLRGTHIVVGKLLVALLRAGQWLLAAVPLAVVTLFFGGVAFSQVMALALALINGLIWSTSVCLLASAFCERWSRAFGLTVTLLGVGIFGPYLVEWLLTLPVSPASPWNAIENSQRTTYSDYWVSLLTVHLEAWLCLALASWRLRRGQVDEPAEATVEDTPEVIADTSKSSSTTGRRRARSIGDRNPIQWLASRDPWLPRLLLLVGVGAVLVFVTAVATFSIETGFAASALLAGVLGLSLHLCIAAQSSRFFADAARTGALELLAISPCSARELVRGQLFALRKSVLLPVCIVMALQLAHAFFSVRTMTMAVATGGAVAAAGANAAPLGAYLQMQLVNIVATLLIYPLSLVALAWFGMFMGLSCKKPGKAFALTVVLAWIAPSIALTFAGGAAMPLAFYGSTPGWIIGAGLSILNILIFAGLWWLARNQIYGHFRELVTGEYSFGGSRREGTQKPCPAAGPPPVLAS